MDALAVYYSAMTESGDKKKDTGDTLPDRRRPGRVDYQNPHLIALLRQEGRQNPSDSGESKDTDAEIPGVVRSDYDHDDLGAAYGIGASILIGIAIWAVIATAIVAVVAR